MRLFEKALGLEFEVFAKRRDGIENIMAWRVSDGGEMVGKGKRWDQLCIKPSTSGMCAQTIHTC